MKNLPLITLCSAVALVSGPAFADIVVRTDNILIDGKIISQDAKEVIIQPDAATRPQPLKLDRATLARVLTTDDHGAILSETPGNSSTPIQITYAWKAPPEPAAPPVPTVRTLRPSYIVVPLKGEIGVTILASILEKSLADAAARQPTAVLLDINSPGGSVTEAEKIIKVLHDYNKKLRIVALVEQDLAAAAIVSLSVKEIYIKPTGTIGAARGPATPSPYLPRKSEDKPDTTTWRAIARNSADEGGRTPLLGDALVDIDTDLHLEIVSGKKVIKAGKGARMVMKKGQMFALSSREAVDCGLAIDQAESIEDLVKKLNILNPITPPNLAAPLAAWVEQKNTVLQKELQRLGDEVQNLLQSLRSWDPSAGPYIQSLSFVPAPLPVASQLRSTRGPSLDDKAKWKDRSLACVITLQKLERIFKEGQALGEAFGQEAVVEASKQALAETSTLRARFYDDRNKYGNHLPAIPAPPKTPKPN